MDDKMNSFLEWFWSFYGKQMSRASKQKEGWADCVSLICQVKSKIDT